MEKIPTEKAAEPKSQKSSLGKKVILEWTAPEYIKHSKGKIWFFVAAILVGLLVAYAVWTRSWTMAVGFIVLAGVYYLSQHHEPREVKVEITHFAIQVGSRTIPFNQIKAFWILYHPPQVKILKLLTTDKLLAEISIQLDGQDPGSVRKSLLGHVPEYEGKTESFVDILIRSFKL